ncbi:hypothetical protein [Amycolatopsis speibonae]|uniref:Uncharacterized protein n=1 Tax=Amycolatopsis speibonae TaxID=1450224 RepID=A0ABV7P7B1_9PSEU
MTVIDTMIGAHVWSTEEKRILVQAARLAPRRRLGDNWALEIQGDQVELYERFDETRWLRDHCGRTRLLACGAVLTHLDVAMRLLGWLPSIDLSAVPNVPDRVAMLKASSRSRPGNRDFARYGAMAGRASLPVPGSLDTWCEELSRDHQGDGVRVAVLSADRAFELPSVGGRIRRDLDPADDDSPGNVFVVTTMEETRHQIVRAGATAQWLRLEATEHGLHCRTVAAPFDAPARRGSLAGTAGVPGTPQLLVIVNLPG